jgi:RND family efflux transporter MFP subunit
MNIKRFIRGHSGLATLIIILVVIFAVVGGRAATKKKADATTANQKPVTLVDARTFRDDISTVSVDGIVESASQADIKSQVSAPVARVLVSIGDNVAAGQTIMEFQNADIRAQLEQARANLSLAQSQYRAGDVSTSATDKSAIDKIRDSYVKADDVVNAQIGQFLFNGNPNNKQLQTFITDSSIGNQLSIDWGKAVDAIRLWKPFVNNLSDTSTKEDVSTAINESQKALNAVSKFLDTLTLALVNATKSADQTDAALINGWKSVTSAGKATISAAISSLTNTGTSITTNQAQITAAEAGVRNLEAQLAKTVITAPISGTIAALPLRTGEFASAGQLITTIVGSGGLQIRAYASSEDIDRIKKDAAATIQGNVPGTVTSVAPSINQINKKVEVRIAIPASVKNNLVVGESVQAKIEAAKTTTVLNSTKPVVYILPIQDVKIIPGAAYVFTVDADSKIVKHEVTLGDVKGDFVEVKSGMTDDMKIVSPVYELEEGQVVHTQ